MQKAEGRRQKARRGEAGMGRSGDTEKRGFGDAEKRGHGDSPSPCHRVSPSPRLELIALASLVLFCCCSPAMGQLGAPQGNSPLYSSRPYSPAAPTGLPAALEGIGIDQKLNEQLPLDATFHDENGTEVKLGQYFGKRPVVLALVYYDCPMLCTQILNGMVGAFKVMSFTPGNDYEIVSVSFDPRETPLLAKAKKKTYVNYLSEPKRSGAEAGWHFLTGNEENIKRLTEAVGFHYRFDQTTNQFAHASAIYVATPEGKLARYFYGIEYAPRDLRLGLVEASENKIGTPVDRLMLYCYHYDPARGKYGATVINLIRAGGVLTLLAIAGLLLMLRRRNGAPGNLHTRNVT
ncbi:MAG TPA: SCO family protein [Pyrinomonadaceae bacterium]|nr:SCO family protein [Pyrinomonadaceae bacterium]